MTRKQVLKAVIFICLVSWLMVHVTYAIRTNGHVKDRFVGFYSEKDNSIDAVIIGSSPVYPCFSTPMIYGDMGISMYPLSSNMQRPVATRYLVEEALKTQSPDLFIFEMRMWTARDEDLLGNMAHTREVTDNLKYSVNRIKAINAMVPEDGDRLSYYFDIFKYHSNWKTLVLWSQLRTWFYEYPEEYKGFVPEMEVGPVELTDAYKDTGIMPIPSEQESYLLDLLAYLKNKNINALFVITPYDVSVEEQQRTNYMANIIRNSGYDFLDMNQYRDEMDFDGQTDFNDYGTHTNVLGAKKVTEFFEGYLEENYRDVFTSDHRGDSSYTSWDKAYEKWLNAYEEGKVTITSNLENGIFYQLDEDDG